MSHNAEWKVRLQVSEEERTTRARLEIDHGGTKLTGQGTARRNPRDPDVPEIGDDLAVARAMEHVAEQLKKTALEDMSVTGVLDRPGSLRPYAGWPDVAGS